MDESTKRFTLLSAFFATLTALALLLSGQTTHAAMLPVSDNDTTLLAEQRSKPSAPEWKCRDKTAMTLYEAGFTGYSHQMAWAIVMRESNGQNLGPGHWAFNGSDYGIWQINAPSHSDKSWWSESAMLDPYIQSRIVYKYMTNKGKYWVPWGLNSDGTLNASQYGMWGPDLWDAWIMEPFQRYMSQYPCKTAPPKEKKK